MFKGDIRLINANVWTLNQLPVSVTTGKKRVTKSESIKTGKYSIPEVSISNGMPIVIDTNPINPTISPSVRAVSEKKAKLGTGIRLKKLKR